MINENPKIIKRSKILVACTAWPPLQMPIFIPLEIEHIKIHYPAGHD